MPYSDNSYHQDQFKKIKKHHLPTTKTGSTTAGATGLAAAFLLEARPFPAGVAGLAGLALALALLARPLAGETVFAAETVFVTAAKIENYSYF